MKTVIKAGPAHTGFTANGYQAGVLSGELAQLQRLLALSSKQADRQLTEYCLKQPGVFEERWLSRRQISSRAWLLAVKCFELGLSGQQTAQLTGLSMPTVYKTLETIRMAVACKDPAWQLLVGALDARNPRPWPGSFAIRKTEGRVQVDVGAAGCEGFDIDASVGGGRKALLDPFLKFFLTRATKHFGIPPLSFPLYLKEYELRFNHRGKPIFDLLMDAVASLRPSGS